MCPFRQPLNRYHDRPVNIVAFDAVAYGYCLLRIEPQPLRQKHVDVGREKAPPAVTVFGVPF